MTDPQNNPYQAPQAPLTQETVGGLPLAPRGTRLGAAIIDSLILILVCLPLGFVFGVYDGITSGVEPGFGQQAVGAVLGIAAFLAVNGVFLSRYGQTVGKRLLKIAIVDQDGHKPDWAPMYLKRYLLWGLVAYIPLLGGLVLLVNYLFIFRGDRRCLHDLTAGTRVVQLPA
ncbi:RDD family protein [Bacillus subtilis]|nr:RDD family protein [Pseudomonas sp. A29(2023)]MDL5591106.1 RDD family protein [Bacillus subtilis]